jgi:hypothetical protein
MSTFNPWAKLKTVLLDDADPVTETVVYEDPDADGQTMNCVLAGPVLPCGLNPNSRG